MEYSDNLSQLFSEKERFSSSAPLSFSYRASLNGANGNARLGLLRTMHGTVETPAFIFCATRAAIKSLSIAEMKEAGSQIILSNTYHLMLKPGGKYIESRGGLQRFTSWGGPMLTDSGGFQAFSLNNNRCNNSNSSTNNSNNKTNNNKKVAVTTSKTSKNSTAFNNSINSNSDNNTNNFNSSNDSTNYREPENIDELKRKYSKVSSNSGILKISEAGILCKSYYDGSEFFLSPERAMEEQYQLGADLIVVLDECTPYSDNLDYNRLALDRNHRWAKRSLSHANSLKQPWQGVYGIIHGGTFPSLRKESVAFISEQDFFGHAIGGSLGRNKAEMEEVVSFSMEYLRQTKIANPVHLLGIGGISDIFVGVELGIDTFDCVHPTRIARHGGALVKRRYNEPTNKKEYINLRNNAHKNNEEPIEGDCPCKTCQNYSRAYLNYLFSVKEPIVFNLLTYHNVFFMNNLMKQIREALRAELEQHTSNSLAEQSSIWLTNCLPGLPPTLRELKLAYL